MYKLALMFVSLLFVIGAPASAAGTDKWVVTQLSGSAQVVHPGLQPASVKVNSQLAPGDTLLTGTTGRATLVRGGDYILVAPRSELRLPSAAQPTGFTRVIQNLGTLLFKVQHTGIPHFAVDTPMLAAVVKGTTFTVVVDQQRSAVQVIQGVVQVSAIDGGMSRMVEGGRTVFVNHAAPKILLDADKPLPTTPSPSSVGVSVSAAGDAPLATIASLTGGLVRADLTAPQATATTAPPVQTLLATAAPSPTPTATTAVSPTAQGTTLGTAPVANTPAPAVTSTVAALPSTATPSATVPSVSVGSVSMPGTTVPSVTTPSVTVPSTTTAVLPVTTPTVTVPSVTAPSATVPSVSVGSVSTPTVTVPSATTPSVTVPSITTPVLPVATPTVTVPSISTTPITVPTPPLPLPKL
jgi:hypothetical protein